MNKPEIEKQISLLKDGDFKVRRNAAHALEEIGDASAIPALIVALKDEDGGVRIFAAKALARIGDTSAVPALIEMLKDKDNYVRRNSVLALGKIGDVSAISELVKVLTDKDEFICNYAAEMLWLMGNSETLPRKIIGASRLSILKRIEALADLRSVLWHDSSRSLRYIFPDTRSLCQTVLNEADTEASVGARQILDWLDGDQYLLQASESSNGSKELLRANDGESPDTHPETLLRACDESEHDPESHPTILQRLFVKSNRH